MDEATWLSSDNPQFMLTMLNATLGPPNSPIWHPASARKLRLFACALWRCAPALLHPALLKAVDAAETWADSGEVPAVEDNSYVVLDNEPIEAVRQTLGWVNIRNGVSREVQIALLRDIFGNPYRPIHLLAIHPHWLTWHDGIIPRLAQAAYDERTKPCPYCQDAHFDMSDLGTPMMGGQEPYASRAARYFRSKCICKGTRLVPNEDGTLDPQRLAILADALIEAGADAEGELVRHLRSPGPHVRGCFVVDTILGKE